MITGTLSGTVKDATGALLPGVTIEVRNTDTGVNRMLTTDERGYYLISIRAKFRLSERANVQFRSEAYNAFNRVNFGTPNGNVFLSGNIQRDGTRGTINPLAGQITTTRGNPRQLQFGLRVEF